MTQAPPTRTHNAIPFLTWVWAGALIVGGAGFALGSTGLLAGLGPAGASPAPLLAAGLAALALPFAVRWLVTRDEWWAPLTAWIFVVLAAFVLLAAGGPRLAQLAVSTLLIGAALPFGALYLADRSRWWRLIPLYGLVVLAALLNLTVLPLPRLMLLAFGVLAAALPVWGGYMADRGRWWLLPPAGLLTIAGVGMLGAATLLHSGLGTFYVLVNATLGLICLALWLTARRFGWLLWMAIGFGLGAVFSIWFPSSASFALVALALGGYIAVRQIEATRRARGSATAPQQSPSQPSQPAQAAAAQQPAAPQPSTPRPPTPGTAPAAPPAASTPATSPGLLADREATAGLEARQAVQGDGRPVVEFRPLDPFKARREQAQKEQQDEEE